MDFETGSKVDGALFNRANSVVIQEYDNRARIMVDQQEIGGITYDLTAKRVYWERASVKTSSTCDGCLYGTAVPHCVEDTQIPRTVIASFPESAKCFSGQTGVIGEAMTVCEDTRTIKVQHPRCPALDATLLPCALDVKCEYDRDCVLRWQQGTITTIVAMDPLGPRV